MSLEPTPIEKIRIKGDDLTKINIYAYGVGHVLNDITASCWFYFLLYFLTEILKISNEKAGLVMLSGQIADGIATPLVGLLSDKTETKCGKRTPWYIGGTITVVICFSLIFQKCFICGEDDSNEVMQLVYYITLPSLFNIGWAAVQVSHMSLLPSISINKKNKDSMVRLRTGFTFISQFITLVLSFIIFDLVEDKFQQYSYLSLVCVFIGIITTSVFLIKCRETELSKNIERYVDEMRLSLNKLNNDDFQTPASQGSSNEYSTGTKKPEQINWAYWLKKTDFYAYMIVYMCVRLSINVTSSMIPYFLDEVLGYNKGPHGETSVYISIILIISMSGSVINSLVIQKYFLTSKNRLVMIMWAGLFVSIGCLPIIFIDQDTRWLIYILSFIFGVGFSLGLSTASNLINDVVGSKGKQGAFVYGAYSFSDKMSCGIVLYFFTTSVKGNDFALKFTTAFLPPISMFFAFLMVLIRRKSEENEIATEGDSEKQKLDETNNLKKSIIDDPRFTFITLK